MIIKSHIRGGFRDAASYLKEQGENEETRLVEISDPHAKTLDEAFRAMWAVSNGTKVKKPLHHVSINPMKDERLTDSQALKIVERLEEKYGYAHGQHQRVIVEHIKDGRQHFHVMWNRVNLTTGKPHYPYMHWKQSKIAAREMEIELSLKRPVSKHTRHAIAATPAAKRWALHDATLEPQQTRSGKKKGGKSGKGDGAGGGTVSGISSLQFGSPKESSGRAIKSHAGITAGNGNGPERRQRNAWVPVERRRQGPPKPQPLCFLPPRSDGPG